MKNTLKKHTTFGLVATVYSIMLFIWFSKIEGMLGTFNWHIEYLSIYIFLCILLPMPPIMLILNWLFPGKRTKISLYVFSIINIVIWSIWLIGLNLLTCFPIDNSKLNILPQSAQIPAKTRAEDEPYLHLAFGSDPHWGSSRANKEARVNILKMIDSQDYDAFYLLGDIAEMGMLKGDYELAVKDLGDYLNKVPLRTIPGNHDAILNGIKNYNAIFQTRGEKHYFRQDYGKTHLLFINMLWDHTELTRKELKWLEKQLKEIPQEETVIVLSHCYAVSSGTYDSMALKNWGDLPGVMKKLCPVLEKYNVDLHLSGHDHFFEYLEKDDVNYLVLGAMGGHLDNPIDYNSPYSKWLNNDTHGYIDMKIYDDYLIFDCVSDNGDIIYSKKLETK